MFFFRFLLLFIPYYVSSSISDPVASYLVAWLGSLFILIYSIGGWLKPIPSDLSFGQQLFRPLFLGQILLMSYTAITPIFYFLNVNGYYFFERYLFYPDVMLIEKVAKCQAYIVLAHAAYVTGLFIKTDYGKRVSPYVAQVNADVYLYISIIFFVANIVVSYTPFRQMSIYLITFSALSTTQYFFTSLKEKTNVPLAFAFFILIFIASLFTGMKEASVLVLSFLFFNLYSIYKTKIVLVALPVLFGYLYILPAINKEFRMLNWYSGVSALDAYEQILSEDYLSELDFKSENWEFLTERSSEMGMFVKYVEYVPERRGFYNFEIVESGLMTLIPRFVWPEKPVADKTAIQRAIDSGAFSRGFDEYTSAKPQIIADAYLSYGAIAISLAFFIIGYLSTRLSVYAEYLFGQYSLGTILIYHSCFYILNRGGCFENMFNSVFYGFFMMLLVHRVFLSYGLLTKYE